MPATDIISKVDVDIKEPPFYRVIYLNDDHTTVDFVVETLIQFFDYNEDTAAKITQDIHEGGSAVVAVLPYEIAEQKGAEVITCARNRCFPLRVKLEPEDN